MNENINLTEILKNCSKGTKLYSTVHGEVSLINSNAGLSYPIVVRLSNNKEESFTAEGKLLIEYKDAECVLFPSKDQRDWSKFTNTLYKNKKFGPNTLKAFDKVLRRDYLENEWECDIFSYIRRKSIIPYRCIGGMYKYCIPYNDDTKHLIGTNKEAPDFYRYWEE